MDLSKTDEYISFRSTVSQKKLIVDDDDTMVWTLYDAGPRSVTCPIVCLPPCSGTADVFFRQLLGLSGLGYRVIAVNYPVCWTVHDWCVSFGRLLDQLHLDQVHILGASLGGFLAQKFVEFTCHRAPRVRSLLLCNSFIDTNVFKQTTSAKAFWLLPHYLLRKSVMSSFNKKDGDPEIASSVHFMALRLGSLTQPELASRLTLNCMDSYVEPQNLEGIDITILDVYDENALTWKVREDTYKCYPQAKRAHLKTGGNFPYLSRSDEVNLFVQIHSKAYLGGKHSPMDPSMDVTGVYRALESSGKELEVQQVAC